MLLAEEVSHSGGVNKPRISIQNAVIEEYELLCFLIILKGLFVTVANKQKTVASASLVLTSWLV